MEPNRIFEQSLDPTSAIGWRLTRLVAELHPGKHVGGAIEGPFDIEDFFTEGQCEASPSPGFHAELHTQWRRKHGLTESLLNGAYDVRWKGKSFRVVVARWREGYGEKRVQITVGDDEASVDEFVASVCAYCNEPRRAVLCFRGGCWGQSHEIWSDIQSASFDDLVLAGGLKEAIRGDLSRFMSARAEYERYGVPYKRGILFVGPPGNGKTHCLRATLKMLGLPVLYVMSLRDKYRSEDSLIDTVFTRAREVAPCVLVFEDLDAMIHDGNRSYFLNQLDGIGTVSGLLTVATTNHADRLDPAIVERPSRFDRKYAFALPASAERLAYAKLWNARLDPAMRLAATELDSLVTATDEFSFAYLRELFLSSMVAWVSHAGTRPSFADVMHRELTTLREQMRAGASAQSSSPPTEDPED